MAETPRPNDAAPTPVPGAEPLSPLDKARARGRWVAFRLYLAVAGAVAVAGGSQVVVQAFAHHAAPELGISTCNEGLGRLAAAVERARVAASGTDGEDAALDHFREALRPDWDDRDHIEDLCRSSPSSLAALDAIERLRYAEEHAARREAAELAPLRRRVQALAPEWAPSAAGTGAPAPPRPTDSSRTERPSP